MSDGRWELAHDGTLVQKETELSGNLNGLIEQLFSQNGWNYRENEKSSSYRNITISNTSGESYDINLYSGSIRNESRNPYEKKIQLGSKQDPREKKGEFTIILGVYVFNKDDELKDSLIAAYPVDEQIKYTTNPSLRGVYVNDVLQKAKLKGLYIDKDRRIVAFRPEFIFFYLENYKQLHQNEQLVTQVLPPEEISMSTIDLAHNRILFGAPGTGKSFKLNEDRENYFHEGHYDRVTFHPNYSYAQFVGTYKPTPMADDPSKITYTYVPGPFIKTWVKAYRSLQNLVPENYLLIIEEINRANVAGVFGEVFQLLDRNDGLSEYSIYLNEDIKRFLDSQFSKEIPENNWYLELSLEEREKHISSMKLYPNMYIWCTMNTADQGVFPIDTAFKRRWNFEYIGINESESKNNKQVELADGRVISWNVLRRGINHKLGLMNINEDKMLGPFFLSKDNLEKNFDHAFKSKLLMYLYEDVIKHRRDEFFKNGMYTYSTLLETYKTSGGDIFNFELSYIPTHEGEPAEDGVYSEEEALATGENDGIVSENTNDVESDRNE